MALLPTMVIFRLGARAPRFICLLGINTSVPIFIFILGWSRTKPRVTLSSAQTMFYASAHSPLLTVLFDRPVTLVHAELELVTHIAVVIPGSGGHNRHLTPHATASIPNVENVKNENDNELWLQKCLNFC